MDWFGKSPSCILTTDKIAEQSYDRYVASIVVYDPIAQTNVNFAHLLRAKGFAKAIERLGPRNERIE